MGFSSIQDKLSRVCPPRVRITYQYETAGAVAEMELPFVVGVLGDFPGNPTGRLKAFRERKLIPIDRDNFNDVMAGMASGLNLEVENRLTGDGSRLSVQ